MKTIIALAAALLLPTLALAQATTYVRFQKGAAFNAVGTASAPINARDYPGTVDPAPGGNIVEWYTTQFDMSAFNSIQLSLRLYQKVGNAYIPVDSLQCADFFAIQTRNGPATFTLPAYTVGSFTARRTAVFSNTTVTQENGQIFTPQASGVDPLFQTVNAITNIDSTFVTFRLIQSFVRVGGLKCYAYLSVVPNTVRDSNIIANFIGVDYTANGETRFISDFGYRVLNIGSTFTNQYPHKLMIQNTGTKPVGCKFAWDAGTFGNAPWAGTGKGPGFILRAGAADYDGTGGTASIESYNGPVYCKTFVAGDTSYISVIGW